MIRLGLMLLCMTVWAEEPTPQFESISEVDLSYFLTNPKIPWGEDPFYRKPGFALVTPPDVNSQFKLAGILYSKNVPLAVINGETVRIGDKIGDRLVTDIGENFVILKKRSSEIELTLPPLFEGDDEDDGKDSEGEE